MTGVPSARDHRKVLEQIRMMKLDSSEVKALFKRQNVENADILQTFHYQESMLSNITHVIRNLHFHQAENAETIKKSYSNTLVCQ